LVLVVKNDLVDNSGDIGGGFDRNTADGQVG
jgi:hypothetical protein